MLGTIRFDKESMPSKRHHHVEFVEDITPGEYKDLVTALNTINQFLRDSQLFSIVGWNYFEFNRIILLYFTCYINNDFSLVDEKPIDININRYFLNLLSSFRSYLDHMDKKLSNRFGKNSQLRSNFKQYCSEEYDGNFSYRFLYGIRNYAQHRGFPINHINLGQRPSSSDPNRAEYYLNIHISRNEILMDHDWKKLTNEIEKLPEFIDVDSHTFSFMKSLKNIHIKIINDLFQTLTESAQIVLAHAKKLSSYKGDPALFELELEGNDIGNIRSMPHKFLPIDVAQKIVDGDISKIFPDVEPMGDSTIE